MYADEQSCTIDLNAISTAENGVNETNAATQNMHPVPKVPYARQVYSYSHTRDDVCAADIQVDREWWTKNDKEKKERESDFVYNKNKNVHRHRYRVPFACLWALICL